MERSPSITNLTQALAKFHAMVGKISKDAKNPFFKSNYASLPHIIDEITEPLHSRQLETMIHRHRLLPYLMPVDMPHHQS